MRFVVVGGGILGLATARALHELAPGAELVLLEKESALATHQSSHNSGVVHQGVYYPPGSLKARLCRRGADLLAAYCHERSVPFEACGKVVVAISPAQLGRLDELERRARANGVPGLRRVDAGELRELEPSVQGIAALHSPASAIVDFGAVARAFADDLRMAGVEIRTGSAVARVAGGSRPSVWLADGSYETADAVVVCAGLHADRLAVASGEPAEPRIVPVRGEYWQLRPERAGLVRGLIYPVPDPALPFLGVHLTRKLDGSVWIGPNAVPALAREGYRRRDVNARDLAETVAWPGTWRMLARHWRAAGIEVGHSLSRRRFVAAAQRYVPALQVNDVISAPAGVRAQALDRDGALVDDFRLSTGDGVVWVRNAPSPAATSCLAIAEELAGRALTLVT